MSEKRLHEIEGFRIREYGKGDARTLCIGGMSHAPGDYEALAALQAGTVFVADNPFHSGRLEWHGGFVEELRQRYVKLSEHFPCETLIAHSCGSFDVLHIQNQLPDVKRMILLTPPNGTRQWVPESSRLEEFGFLDRCLADLCKDLPDELYRMLLERHRAEYAPNDKHMKQLYRHEMPARRQETFEGVLTMMRSSRKQLLVVFGRQDPWLLTEPNGVDHGKNTTVRVVDTGHFPHISQPAVIQQLIDEWIAGRLADVASDSAA